MRDQKLVVNYQFGDFGDTNQQELVDELIRQIMAINFSIRDSSHSLRVIKVEEAVKEQT